MVQAGVGEDPLHAASAGVSSNHGTRQSRKHWSNKEEFYPRQLFLLAFPKNKSYFS
jgi:hypothetical protein